MDRTIPVWQTLSDAFSFVHQKITLFLSALLIPSLILVAVQLIFLFLVSDPQSPIHFVFDLVSLMVFAWMMNVCCRIAITESAGKLAWTSCETWTALWLVGLSFVVSVLAALPALALFAALSFITPMVGMIAGLICFSILHFYLFARFILVFPATAMGDKASFREAWEMSKGNGWRLVVLFGLVPFIYCLVAMVLGILLPVRLFIALLSIVGIFFALVGVVAVALSYKRLKNN